MPDGAVNPDALSKHTGDGMQLTLAFSGTPCSSFHCRDARYQRDEETRVVYSPAPTTAEFARQVLPVCRNSLQCSSKILANNP